MFLGGFVNYFILFIDGILLGGFVNYFNFLMDGLILGGFGVCSTLQCSVMQCSVKQYSLGHNRAVQCSVR